MRRFKPLHALAGALLCLPLFAHAADCTARFEQWTKTLDKGRKLYTERAACKVWPANPALTLAVLPLLPHGAGEDRDDMTFDLEVLVAETQTGKVVAHRFEANAITSDAVQLRNIALDTALWHLTPQSLAFGVRISWEGMSRANPMSEAVLSLYEIDGKSLRKVLTNLGTAFGNGEWDTNCAGYFDDGTRSVSLGAPGKLGYAKLIVSEKSTHSDNKLVGDECRSTDTNKRAPNVTLEFDGTQYVVPKHLVGGQ